VSRSRFAALIAVVALGVAAAGMRFALAQPESAAEAAGNLAGVRFATIDVYVDSREPLAAWQFELTEATGAMAVVGVENGESAAFAGTPHYDLDAVAQGRAERIIVADYSLGARATLPVGRTRVATVHVRLSGTAQPEFALQLIAAGNAAGEAIDAAAVIELQEGRAE
jgi:hypothetical protein